MRSVVAVLSSIVLAAACPRLYPQETTPLVSCTATAPLSAVQAGSGFAMVRFEVRNDSNEDHQLKLVMQSWTHGLVEKSFNLAAGERGNYDLVVPASNYYYTLESDGDAVLSNSINVTDLDRSMSRGLSSRGGTDAGSWLYVGEDTPDATKFKFFVTDKFSVLDPDDLPTRWEGLTCLDNISMRASTLCGLDSTRLESLRRYVETGGFLIVWSSDGVPRAEIQDALPALVSLDEQRGEYGLGYVVLLSDEPFPDERAMAWSEFMATLPISRLQVDDRLGMPPITHYYGWGYGGINLTPCRLPGLDEVPAQLFAILVMLYVIVVGPINFWWLSRRGRRGWLVVTIPAISLVTFVLMTGYSIVSEGLDVKVSPRTITWIDNVHHRAATFSNVGYFAGFAPSGGLRFGVDTTAVSVPHEGQGGGRRRSLESRARRIDLSDGMTLAGKWIAARTPLENVYLQAGPLRDRITFGKKQGRKVLVTNGLRTRISRLVFMLADGSAFEISDLAPAASGEADLIEGDVAPVVAKVLEVGDGDTWVPTSLLDGFQLGRESFVGLTDAPAFLDCGVEDPTWLQGRNVIKGIFEEGGE